MSSFGGGGFNNDSGASPGGASDGANKPRRNYDEQTLIPVTIKMIHNAVSDPSGGESISLKDGRPIHMVKLVAAVRSHEVRSTNIFIDVEDGTGFAQVKVWANEGEDCSAITNLRQQACADHVYVRIIGQLREYDGARQIVASDIRPLTSGNELTYHFLEVAHSYEKISKMQQQPANVGGYGIGSVAPNNAPPQGGAMGVQMQGGQGGGSSGGNALNDAVIRVVQAMGANQDGGVHVDTIKAEVSSQGYSEGDITRAISDLSNEGHIYSTIDDLHFQYAA